MRNYRRRRYDDGNEIDGEGSTAEARLSSSRYSSACADSTAEAILSSSHYYSIPRKINGEGAATAEAKPQSSIPRKIIGEGASKAEGACVFLMDEDGEEDVPLPVTITYEECIHGSSRELYSFSKELLPLYPAAVSVFAEKPGRGRKRYNAEDEDLQELLFKFNTRRNCVPDENLHELLHKRLCGKKSQWSHWATTRDGTVLLHPPNQQPLPQQQPRQPQIHEYHADEDEDLHVGEITSQGSHWTTVMPLHPPNQQPLPQQQPQIYEYHAEMPLGSVPNVSVPELAKKESHDKTFAYLAAPLMSIAAREGSLSVPVDKFVFVQKVHDSASVIRDFLQEKVSLIEEIEVQMKEFHEKHASAILERRTANDHDEMVELGAAAEAAMAVLNKQGNTSSAFDTATSAALAVSAFIRQRIDEFGRDKNLRARKRASAMGIDGSCLEIQGESSTDESDCETSAYKETRAGLLECADTVFNDASDLYSRLSRVRTRFRRWKRKNSSTYRDDYMYLDVPSIFSPYVRLELLKWDPLHQDVDFRDMKWHGLLFDNGKPEDVDDFETDDTDANLVSELVEKVAIPILHHRIVRCWDVLSTRETRNVVAATSMVKGYVPASSEALAELLAAIRARLVEAIAAITVPTWDPMVLKAVPKASQAVAYRFGTSVRLMRNICMWKGILALPMLENLALSDLLFGKVLPHVRGIASDSNIHDAVTRTERIVASLSGVWTGPRTHSHPLLQPLVDYCTLTLGRIIETRLDDAETIGLACRLKGILVQIHEHEHSRAIVTTFNLKEAL